MIQSAPICDGNHNQPSAKGAGAIHRSEPTYANPQTFPDRDREGLSITRPHDLVARNELAFCARPTRPVRCDYQFGICHKASTFMRSSAVPGFGFGSLVM